MPTGVFFVSENKPLAEEVFNSLKECDVPVRPYCFSSQWRETPISELPHLLSDLLHFVVIPPEDPDSEAWFSFIMGYASGKEIGVSIYCPRETATLPVWHMDSTVHTALDDLVKNVSYEYRTAFGLACMDRARDEIVQRGYGITDDAFASVVTDGNAELVELFLQLGMSGDTVNSSGVPVLNLAVRGGHLPLIEILLAKDVNVNAVSADRGNTALVEAASRGMTSLVRLLLESGAEPDIQTRSGQTALMLAVAEGHLADAEVLLEAGANPDMADKLGMSARKYASLFKHESLLPLMVHAGDAPDESNLDSSEPASLSYAGNAAE